MKRRNLLRVVAALPLLSGGFAAMFGLPKNVGAVASRRDSRVRLSDPQWPSAASWAKLKEEVGGQLIEPTALFGSCLTDSNGAACLEAH